MIPNEKIYKDFWQEIEKYNSFLIVTHIRPDGDAISSVILMAYILSKKNKRYNILLNDNFPLKYNFLKDKYYKIIIPELLIVPDNKDLLNMLPENYFPEVIIILDTCGKDRLGNFAKYFNKARIFLNLDHHLGERFFKGKVDLVDRNASATGEILFDLIDVNNFEVDLTVAELSYTAIVADTRFFTQPNTTPHTLEVAARCLEKGVSPEYIYKKFSEKDINTVKVFGIVMSRAKMENNIILSFIKKEEIEMCKDNDLDGLIEILRDIEGARGAVLFKELDKNKIKVSLRGKDGFDVFRIAEKFNGGGHKQAAGCTIEKNLEETMEIIKRELHLLTGK